jgi:Kef-type K+ transport system membrane component KefB
MGRIPGFTKNIFPPASIPNLTLVANIGLVLFLFLVGLEADFSVFKSKKIARSAIFISIAGLAIPFGMGAAVSVGVYNRYVDTSAVDFGIFLLFIGTAMA